MMGSDMDMLDEIRADIRPMARRINMAANPYAAFCITLWLLSQELRMSLELRQEAFEHVSDILDGEPPSKRSGLRDVDLSNH
jgi:hypothetical protein